MEPKNDSACAAVILELETKIRTLEAALAEKIELANSVKESENKYRSLVQYTSDPVFAFNPDETYRFVNAAFAKAFGKTPEEIIGKTPHSIFPFDEAEKRLTLVRRVFKTGERGEILVKVAPFPGVEKWYLTIVDPIKDDNGVLLWVACQSKDITERKLMEDALKASEEKYRGLVQGLPDGIAIYVAGKIVFANTASVQLMRGKSVDDLLGRSIFDFIHPESMELAVKRMTELMNTGKPLPTAEEKFIRLDGTDIDVDVKALPITYENQPAIQIIVRDITERKNSEQILRDVQRRESIGVLSSGIAHDFNNLLGAMMGNVSLAQSRIPPGHPAAKNLEHALTAMERAAALTKQMLAYSGKGKFQISTVDVTAIVQEHISLFEVSVSKNVKFTVHLPPLPVYVKGDPGQIEQIVLNLIVNGGEAIGEAPGNVTIDVSAVSMSAEKLRPFVKLTQTALKEGEYALLTVKDDGEGMSRETINKIFDPFFTTKTMGRGLGLSAVLGIIRSHDGGIAIESTEGVGTTFMVLLPICQTERQPAALHADALVEAAGEPTTILVIDDETYIVEIANEILETGKYKTLSTVNPLEGIELYERHREEIGLVLLDLSMPEMNGKEVLTRLRTIDPKVKVILSSGYSNEDADRQTGGVKADAFIHKPYAANDLLSIVRRVMGEA